MWSLTYRKSVNRRDELLITTKDVTITASGHKLMGPPTENPKTLGIIPETKISAPRTKVEASARHVLGLLS
jgi:hypothetical protein